MSIWGDCFGYGMNSCVGIGDGFRLGGGIDGANGCLTTVRNGSIGVGVAAD